MLKLREPTITTIQSIRIRGGSAEWLCELVRIEEPAYYNGGMNTSFAVWIDRGTQHGRILAECDTIERLSRWGREQAEHLAISNHGNPVHFAMSRKLSEWTGALC